jgi:hypothetical protein
MPMQPKDIIYPVVFSAGIGGTLWLGYQGLIKFVESQKITKLAATTGKSTSELEALIKQITAGLTGDSDLDWYENPELYYALADELGLEDDEIFDFVSDSVSDLWEEIFGTTKDDDFDWESVDYEEYVDDEYWNDL